MGKEVRLRYAFFVTCKDVVKDAAGNITELRCTYDPATRGGNAPDGRKVKATMHWVNAQDAISADVHVYEHLFNRPDPGADGDVMADINPHSSTVLSGAKIEPDLLNAKPGQAFQFERQGYFCMDKDSTPAKPVFIRTVGLRETYAKEIAKPS